MDPDVRARLITALMEPFPAEIVQTKQGMTYVEAEYVRERLIDATGNQFDWVVDKQEYREDGAISQDKAKAVDVTTGERKPILVAVCTGRLTIPGLGTRSGVGVQEMQHNSGADAAYKGAESDALKRAAMAFGVGLRQFYIETNKHEQQRARATPRPVPATVKTWSIAEYGEAVRIAIQRKDAGDYRELVDQASTDDMWAVLVKQAATEDALDWVSRAAERAGHLTQVLALLIANRGAEIAAAIPDATPAPSGRPASTGQIDRVRDLARQAGWDATRITALVDGIADADDAKVAIADLTDTILSAKDAQPA